MDELYNRTVERLRRGGRKDPTAQIVYLAEEIECYREKIRFLEDELRRKPPAQQDERIHSIPGGCRPCEVDGQPALFHRWVEEEKGVLIVNFFATEDMADSLRRKFEKDGIVAGGCSLEKLRQTLALIEWPGGTVETVPVGEIRFTDKEG